MECNQLPAPHLWDEAAIEKQKEFRLHLQFCPACHQRVLKEAPEKLLFEMNESPLPEDFWLGFWDSVDRKRKQEALQQNSESLRKEGGIYPVIRWVSVMLIGMLILLYGSTFPETTPGKIVELRMKLMALHESDALPVNGTTNFRNYDLLDEKIIRSEAGTRANGDLAEDYRVTFIAGILQEGSIGLKNFELRKIRRGKGGKTTASPLISSSLKLRNSQSMVFMTKPLEHGEDSLLLILEGKVKK